MPIPIIAWVVVGFVAGATFATFWDQIKEWASRMLGYILDAINTAFEVTSDAVVYFVKEGSRIYKEIEVYVRDIRTGKTRVEGKRQEIPNSEVPNEFEEQLAKKAKVKILQQKT